VRSPGRGGGRRVGRPPRSRRRGRVCRQRRGPDAVVFGIDVARQHDGPVEGADRRAAVPPADGAEMVGKLQFTAGDDTHRHHPSWLAPRAGNVRQVGGRPAAAGGTAGGAVTASGARSPGRPEVTVTSASASLATAAGPGAEETASTSGPRPRHHPVGVLLTGLRSRGGRKRHHERQGCAAPQHHGASNECHCSFGRRSGEWSARRPAPGRAGRCSGGSPSAQASRRVGRGRRC
jgi:hypothetical protein